MTNTTVSQSLAYTGMKKGGKAGFYLSLVYNLMFPIIWFYTDPSHQLQQPGIRDLLSWMFVMPFYGLVIGCLPATILGGMTGWLVGKAFSLLANQLTLFRSLLMGLGVTVSIALLMNWFVVFDSHQPSPWLWNWNYLVYLGIPTLIYIAASPVVSYRLYRDLTE